LWVCGEKPCAGLGKTSHTCLKGYVRKGNLKQHLKEAHEFSGERAEAMARECHYKKTNRGNRRQLNLWVCRVSVSGEKASGGSGKTSDVCLEGRVRKNNFKEHLKRAHKFKDERAKELVGKYHYTKTDPGNEPCRLCGDFPKFELLRSHVAEHFEHISLCALQDQEQDQQDQQDQQQRKRKRKQQQQQEPKKRAKKAAVSASSLNDEQHQQEPKTRAKNAAVPVSSLLNDEHQEPKKAMVSVSSLLKNEQDEQELEKTAVLILSLLKSV
jgi:hypothetical protein